MRTRLADIIRARFMAAPAVRAGALLAAALVTCLGVGFTNAEGIVAGGFAAALSKPSVNRNDVAGGQALVAGTEEFWLADQSHRADAGGRIQPVTWTAQMALGVEVGDRITIKSGGVQRSLEVVDVAEAQASVTRVESDKILGHQVLVTCRDTSDDQEGGQLVQFLTYTSRMPATAAAAAKPQRTL